MWYPPRLFILLACPLPSLCRGAMLAAVVPLLVPSGGSPLVPACLMFSAVLRRFAPSLAARAWLRAVSPCVPRLVPHPASSRHRCRCLCCYRPMASRYPPRLIDTTGGASSSVVRCPVASRAVVASSCLACPVPLVRVFLRCLCRACLLFVSPCRRIVRLPVCSTSGAGRFGLRLGLGSPRSLLPVACRCRGCDGRFISWGVARCLRVDGVGWRGDFRRSRCLPWWHYIGLACLARAAPPCPCLLALVVCGSWRSRYHLRSCLVSSPLLACPCRRVPSWVD